jgi:hypothetical protein
MIADLENEDWKDVKGWEGEYQVSNMGRVKSLQRMIVYADGRKFSIKERILKPGVDDKGYLRVVLSRNQKHFQIQVHQLVARVFIPNPENKETVNHKWGTVGDNRVSELEWFTRSEQQKHAFEILGRKHWMTGRTGEKSFWFGKKGENHPAYGNKNALGRKGELSGHSRKVRCDTLGMSFNSMTEAAEILGISGSFVWLICSGKEVQTKGLTFRYI